MLVRTNTFSAIVSIYYTAHLNKKPILQCGPYYEDHFEKYLM